MRWRPARVAAVTLLSLLLVSAPALGDADPASDVLLAADVFYPYSPPVPATLQTELNAEIAAAHEAHFPVKVAIIASRVDLGAIPELFGKPQQYATFLDQEITFAAKVPLLVVMPHGYGTARVSSAAAAAVAALGRPPSTSSSGLTHAAIVAVRKLAAAAGRPVGRPYSGSASGGGSSGVALPLAILIAVCVTMAGAILTLRRRRASTSRASATRRR